MTGAQNNRIPKRVEWFSSQCERALGSVEGLQFSSGQLYRRAALVIATVLFGSLLLAWLLSSPVPLQVLVKAECNEFEVPVELSLQLPVPKETTFFWYSSEIQGTEPGAISARLVSPKADPAYPPSIQLTLEGNERPPLQFVLHPGVWLRINGRTGVPVLEIAHQTAASVTVSTQVMKAILRTRNLAGSAKSGQVTEREIKINNRIAPSSLKLTELD